VTDAGSISATVQALRAVADQLEEAPPGAVRRMLLKDAAFVAGISEPQMRRRCEQNVYGDVAGGYGFKDGGRWEVVIAPFVATLPVSALPRVNSINRAWTRD
jgi:phenylacetate-coenzyme A ligase PaaK-like adenylate-forming protein